MKCMSKNFRGSAPYINMYFCYFLGYELIFWFKICLLSKFGTKNTIKTLKNYLIFFPKGRGGGAADYCRDCKGGEGGHEIIASDCKGGGGGSKMAKNRLRNC